MTTPGASANASLNPSAVRLARKSPTTRILRAFSSFSTTGSGGGATLGAVLATLLVRAGCRSCFLVDPPPPNNSCRKDFRSTRSCAWAGCRTIGPASAVTSKKTIQRSNGRRFDTRKSSPVQPMAGCIPARTDHHLRRIASSIFCDGIASPVKPARDWKAAMAAFEPEPKLPSISPS